ncbi:hypothetical protein [Streptomyces sp. NPDC008139]|uniref:hypothetical protein n=1 Tax=Streptomyces sp. NPDC008139 TaxID=3364814 RepID=UPI0036E58C38
MADLKVTDQVLADSERLLTKLHFEFKSIKAHRDDLHHIWGSGAVAGAMDAFVNNWAWYRKKLIGGIESVGGLVGAARETFKQTDEHLAKSG